MLRLRVAGELTLEVDGATVELPPSRRAVALLAWLALHPGLHPRADVAARFWPDVLDTSARASLRSAIWALRQALGADGDGLLVATRDRVGLTGSADLWIDIRAFEELLAEDRLEEALELCDGALLTGLEDDWVVEARDEHRERVAGALNELARRAEREGDVERAIQLSRRRCALDPLDEAAARDLIRCLAASGDRAGALGAYERLRDRFRRDLGLSPSAETRALVDAVREGAGTAQPSRAGAPRAPARAELNPLVGREAELAELVAVWERVRRGNGAAATVSGEAGIGKTRITAELAHAARAAGARVAACAGLDFGGAAPFGLWAELLHELAADLEPPPGATWAADVARLAPGLEPRLGRPVVAVAPELERARLFEAIVALIEWAARERPLLLLMDDLHLADAASLELAAYVGRRLGGLAAMMVLIRRDRPRRAELDKLETSLRRRDLFAATLTLSPLPARDMEQLVRGVGSLDDAQVERLVEAAEGNPLLAVESARALAGGEDAVPASLRGALRAALASLPPDGRVVAEFAAVAGRDLERDEAAALPVARSHDAAAACIEEGLLVARDGRLGYRHGLLREAVYSELPEPRRAWLHETFADVLGRRAGPDAPRRAAEIARHLRRAGRDGAAVAYLARAAQHARAVAALDEAASFLEEAVLLSPDDPDLLLELADVEAWRHRRQAADAVFQRALPLVDPSDPRKLARAWLRRARFLRGALCYPSEALLSYRAALELLDPAAHEVLAERAEALAGAAWAEAAAGDVEVVDDLLEEIERVMAGTPRGDLLTHDVAHARVFAMLRRGRFADTYELQERGAAAAQRAGRPDMVFGCWDNAASAAACTGDFERALAFVDRALAAVSGIPVLEVSSLAARAHVLARLGRFEAAREAAEAERRIADLLDEPEIQARADHDRGVVAFEEGDFERAEAMLARALDGRARVSRSLARITRAEALVRLGRADEAERELRDAALEPVAPSDFPDTLVVRLTRVQGLVAAARGDRELAERRLREAAGGWRRHMRGTGLGDSYMANLTDLGRPPVAGMIEPARELERVEADLEALASPVTP